MSKPSRKNGNQAKITIIFIMIIFFIFSLSNSLAYIMPSEQLLEFMRKNFSKINTLVIIQSTLQEETSAEDEIIQKHFKEQLWLKSPAFFQSRILTEEGTIPGTRDLRYRRLIMAESQSDIEAFLRDIGIELDQVMLSRLEKTIVYQIGNNSPHSPRLLVEKKRFLPLLISYPLNETSYKMVTVRFQDYRELEKGWYPFQIIYFIDEQIKETSTIQSCEVNVPINASLFSEKSEKSFPKEEKTDKAKTDENRLRRIIKAFEEKYR